MSKQQGTQEDRLYRIRHSAAHVMAQAVRELYPDARLAIGPPIQDGFYYDFDLGMEEGRPRTFLPEDLEEIERRMRRIIGGQHPFVYREVDADEARELFVDEPYKLELIKGLVEGTVDEYGEETEGSQVISTYTQDTFEDLCRGPHVEHTGQIPIEGVKLMSVAGAYWRGDEHRPMLQRIYGTAWANGKQLKRHLKMLEEARQRDHRKLGRELSLFVFDEEVGPGLPLWLPNGEVIINELEQLAREMETAAGYRHVRTPHLTKESLFQRSGHLPYYADSMYPPMEMEGVRYYIKPMNCPMHHKIYGSEPRSYRDLPLRLAEYGTCYRYEKSGELMGLMRVRSMQMNDAHIYCSEEQFASEFMGVIDLYLHYFRLFGIEQYQMRLSTHHPKGLGKKYVDNARLWARTEDLVRRTMQEGEVPYVEVADEAAFYGPKIDVQVWSAIGREFTLATNQVDFAVPTRFDLVFVNSDGVEETPLCIHRAPLSTHERMIGFLTEHYGGNFPLWLAPEQVRIVPITDDHVASAEDFRAACEARGLRAGVDASSARMNAKIRQAQLLRIPVMAVIGDREVADDTVSLRLRSGQRRQGLPRAACLPRAADLVAERSADLPALLAA
ncbi:MAG: threonine--tRNA ligase [Caldilineaceae bacterium]|nr:threonine--tRNA ligase [Caldilineaceae bacterium]